MTGSEARKLFEPIRVGNIELTHRVVLAPLGRFRADGAHVPTDLMVEYYSQRASVPGTLLISEATMISPRAGGYDNLPGIWSEEQISGWRKIVDAAHAQGSFMYMQLWAVGRAADPAIISQHDCIENPGGPYPYVSASDIPLGDHNDGIKPRSLTHDEILEYIELYGQAAHNAVHRAGFDGVEIHGAHGYLIDQFTQDVSNKRTDQWGGSMENRIRFALEVVQKVVRVVGEERTGIRLSPFNTFQDMRMHNPEPTFSALVSRIREAYPRFAYLHVVEPRIAGACDREALAGESNDFLRTIWKRPDSASNGSVYISAGGYTPGGALEQAENDGELVAFGRHFISNVSFYIPDLPERVKKDIPFTPYNRDLFYAVGLPTGYVDYPFANDETRRKYQENWAKWKNSNAHGTS
ncbi:NADH:flavin oxidoreductase/NADH oxidase [Sanghuangporus baumii]|uniref:NADH:flavin oxidoreductase/NADH oxidase n=1 Tax=Sanghuangporus baumii TaxID=108892 RepID=A0A9Q5I3U7_SANBA|nr:NADH:flavin oxidoreductase/NADH oxidase [Sanghuangporus baumii]